MKDISKKLKITKMVVLIVAILTSVVVLSVYGEHSKENIVLFLLAGLFIVFLPAMLPGMLQGTMTGEAENSILVLFVLIGFLFVILSIVVPAILAMINIIRKKEGRAALVLPIIALVISVGALIAEVWMNNSVGGELIANSPASVAMRVILIVVLAINIYLQKRNMPAKVLAK